MIRATEIFDPYAAWLNIDPDQRPIDHYLLLGIPRFEADVARIAAAADERMAKIRNYQQGPRAAFSQKLLNELAMARVCLLDPGAKASYDSWLTAMTPRKAPEARVLGIAPAGPPLPPVAQAAPPVAPPLPPTGQELEQDAVAYQVRPWGLMGLIALGLLLMGAPMVWWYQKQARMASPQPQMAPLAQEDTDTSVETDSAEAPPADPEDSAELQRAVVLEQEADGAVNFTPATAVLQGDVELAVAGTEYVLINWTGNEDSIRWRFRLLDPAIFTVQIRYVADAGSAGGRIGIRVGEEEKILTTRTAERAGEPVTDTVFLKIGQSGQHVLTLRGLDRPGKEYCILLGVRIVPPKAEPPRTEPVE